MQRAGPCGTQSTAFARNGQRAHLTPVVSAGRLSRHRGLPVGRRRGGKAGRGRACASMRSCGSRLGHCNTALRGSACRCPAASAAQTRPAGDHQPTMRCLRPGAWGQNPAARACLQQARTPWGGPTGSDVHRAHARSEPARSGSFRLQLLLLWPARLPGPAARESWAG